MSPARAPAAGAGDEPTMSALSPTRPAATHADAPVSPSQAAAAAAAAVASAAAAAAAEVTRRSLEAARAEDRTEDPVETNLDLSKSVDIAASTSEFLPPGTPVRDAFERAPAEPAANAADAPTTDAVAIAAEPSQKADASTSSLPHFSKEASTDPGPEANTTAVADVQTTEPSEPSPASAAQTHFLRKDGGNQPEVMNSIAGLFGPAEMEADEDSRDRAFEEALERVRQSRRDIADKAAKGFSDMKAYYEAELREAKAHGLSAAPAEIPVSSVAASVAAAAAAAEAADAGGARRGGTAWDLDERALAASLPVPSDVSADETRADAKTSPRDSVWPEAWRGSYSPPKEPAPPPFPLSQAWSEPPGDRAPENPPEVRYPHDAAKAAEALAASVAAAQRLAEATGGGSPRASAEAARVRRSSERARGEAAAGADANPDPDASPEALARRAKRLEENLAAAERREQTAERAATDAERKAESLAAELRDAKAKLQARDAEVRELGKATAALKEGVDEAKGELGETSRKLSAANAAVARMTAEATEQGHKRAALERSVAELGGALDAAKRENIALKSKLSRAEDDVERLRTRAEESDAAAREDAKRREALARDAEAARREGQMLRAHNQKGAQEASGLATSLQSAKEEIADLRERCRRAEREALLAATQRAGDAAAAAAQTKKQTRTEPPSQTTRPARVTRDRDAPAARPFSHAHGGAPHVEPEPVPGRELPAARPFSSAYGGASRVEPEPVPGRELPAARPFSSAYGGASRVEPEPVPGRELPAARPFSSAYGGASRVEPEPVPGRELPAARPFSSAYRGDENVPPEARKTWDIRAAGVRSSDISKSHAGARSLWSEQAAAEARAGAGTARAPGPTSEPAPEPAPVPVADATPPRTGPRADHLGPGMVPVRGAERREASVEDERAPEREGEDVRDGEATAAREVAAAREAASHREAETARARATTRVVAEQRAGSLYSAAEAAKRGREGSGWYGGYLEGGPPPPAPPAPRASDPPPWILPAESSPGTAKSVGSGAFSHAHVRPSKDDAPFATADSFASWSSHVAAAEARLMKLSQEKDALEGELSRMPDGAGRTIEQRRKKAEAERRLEEVCKAQSVARHQLKAANRMHLVGS